MTQSAKILVLVPNNTILCTFYYLETYMKLNKMYCELLAKQYEDKQPEELKQARLEKDYVIEQRHLIEGLMAARNSPYQQMIRKQKLFRE